MHACSCVCLCVCLSSCLSACLPACVCVCLSVCVRACLRVCVRQVACLGCLDTATLLLDAGADVNARNNDGSAMPPLRASTVYSQQAKRLQGVRPPHC